MKNTTNRFQTSLVVCLIALLGLAGLRAADLTENDKQFLAKYEQVRAALAADNLANAKKAATDLGDEGSALTQSEKIATAREEFSKLSARAISLAAGQTGYYIVTCPMLHKDWVQPRGTISNPYAGSSMPTCGAIRKQAN